MRHGVVGVFFALALAASAVMSARNSASQLIWYQFSEGTGTTIAESSATTGWSTTMSNARANWVVAQSSPEPRGIEFSVACSSNCATGSVFPPPSPTPAAATTSGFMVSSAPLDSEFGLELWLRTSNTSQNALIADVALGAAGTNEFDDSACSSDPLRALMVKQVGDVVVVRFIDKSSATSFCSVCSTGSLVAGALYHIVLAKSATYGASLIYVNGASAACTAVPSVTPSTLNTFSAMQTVGGGGYLSLGSRRNGAHPWTGRLYMLAFFNNAPSAGQVATNYAAGPYNVVPSVASFSITGVEDTALLITLNATDPYDSVFILRISVTPSAGSLYQVAAGPTRGAQITAAGTAVTDPSGRVFFEAAANANGLNYATFAFTAEDGEAVSPPATVTVSINPVNDAPTASAPTTLQTNTYGIQSAITGFSVADNDTADVLTVSLHASSGLLTIDPSTVIMVVGDGVDDTAMRFRAVASAANTALATLKYEGLAPAGGSDSIVLSVFDDTVGAAAAARATATVTVTGGC